MKGYHLTQLEMRVIMHLLTTLASTSIKCLTTKDILNRKGKLKKLLKSLLLIQLLFLHSILTNKELYEFRTVGILFKKKSSNKKA